MLITSQSLLSDLFKTCKLYNVVAHRETPLNSIIDQNLGTRNGGPQEHKSWLRSTEVLQLDTFNHALQFSNQPLYVKIVPTIETTVP